MALRQQHLKITKYAEARFTMEYLIRSNSSPLNSLMLHATCSNGTIRIAWQTASEQNNDFFTLYRSYDGIVFTAIATISGAGNSNSLLNYMYDDNTIAQGVVYYKLAQTDYDGTTIYSKILAVSTCGNPAIYSFKEGEITISFENSDIPNHILITSIDGKFYFRKYIPIQTRQLYILHLQTVYMLYQLLPIILLQAKNL